jgi:predicted Zn-dependent protease
MKRGVVAFVAIALGAMLFGAVRSPGIGTPDRSSIRHIGVAGGTIARAFGRTAPARPTDAVTIARRRLAEEGAGTYIDDILAERDSSVIRWPDRRGMPLAVWVQPNSAVQGFAQSYPVRVKAAFAQWNSVHLPVDFAFVDDSADADVHVSWIDHFDEQISGRTRWAHDDDWTITDANIVLAVHHAQGDRLEDDAMEAMALHEIGHLLGLDHTADTLAVMAPRVRVRELSDADRATARLLYALPTGPLR